MSATYTEISLSDLLREFAGDTLVHNDRGNGCGGPGYEDATDVLAEIEREEREDDCLTPVAETEDAEAWALARDAFRALGLDPATIRQVLIGQRLTEVNGQPVDNGHQMVYAI